MEGMYRFNTTAKNLPGRVYGETLCAPRRTDSSVRTWRYEQVAETIFTDSTLSRGDAAREPGAELD